MKKSLTVFVLAATFATMQACEPKKEKNAEETVAVEQTEEQKKEMARADKRAMIEKKRIERVEKRKLELEERIKKSNTYTSPSGKTIYYKAEVDPSFAGGESAMNKYLSENIKYPADAQDNGDEGTVFIDFVVDEMGNVSDVKETDGYGEEIVQSLRDEATRVVKSMPKWAPGRQQGKAVQVSYNLPITFKLN
jgi:TonB family protein